MSSQAFWNELTANAIPSQFPSLLGHQSAEKAVFSELHFSTDVQLNTQKFKDLADNLKVTRVPFLQAAWAHLIAGYMGQSDVIFSQIDEEATFPYRVQLDQFSTPKELILHLERLNTDRDSNLDATAEIQSEDKLGITTLLVLPGAEPKADFSQYSLTAQVDCEGDIFKLDLFSNTDLLTESHLSLIAQQLAHFVNYFIDNLESPINLNLPQAGNSSNVNTKLFSIIPSQDLKSLGYDEELKFLHSGLEKFAKSHPDLKCLRFLHQITENGELDMTEFTYSQLNDKANQLAHYLIQNGLQVEQRVAVSIPRSPLFYIAFFAISKAGGAYVPIDPAVPQSRKQYLAQESDSKFILTVDSLSQELFNPDFATNIVSLDNHSFNNQLQSLPTINPVVTELTPDHLAYIIFTSGTTGKPKGVLVEHNGVALYNQSFIRNTGQTMGSNHLMFANCTFDPHVSDIVTPTYSGGVLNTSDLDSLLVHLEEYMKALDIEYSELTPSVASLLNRQNLPKMKKLIVGGESITASLIQQWGNGAIINSYGPTEASIGCTFKSDVTTEDKTSNIGFAIEHCSAYIMKEENGELQPVPWGFIGELCIGGVQVARGYLNRPDLTEKVFKTYQTSQGGEPVYKTGDLARLNVDGSIEYLGRFDHQVKINGIRIELAEISESITQLNEGVQCNVQLLKHAESAKKELVAFITSPEYHDESAGKNNINLIDPEVTDGLADELLSQLKKVLPIYMIPTHFLLVNQFPITPNGKVDGKTLAGVFVNMPKEELIRNKLKAQTEDQDHEWTVSEELVRNLVSEIAKIDVSTISYQISILELGVDSLSAIQLSNKLKDLGKPISVFNLMKLSTIEAIAGELDNNNADSNKIDQSLKETVDNIKKFEQEVKPKLVSQLGLKSLDSIEEAYPCTPLQEGMLVISLSSPHFENVNSLTYKISQNVDLGKLRAALQSVVDNNSILRTGFFGLPDGDYQMAQAVIASDAHKIQLDVQEIESSEQLTQVIKAHQTSIVSTLLTGQPPYRISLVNSSESNYFVFTLHHSLFDGWSLPLMFEDLAKAYLNKELVQPPNFRSVSEYIHAQDLENSLSYFKQQFESHIPTIFPCLFPNDEFEGELSSNTTYQQSNLKLSQIQQIGKKAGVTPQTLLQSAWVRLLSSYTNEKDVIFGNVVAGRSIPVDNVEDIRGPCLNTMPFRINLNNHRATISHSHPSSKDFQIYWHNGSTPLFDTLFVFQNIDESQPLSEGLWDLYHYNNPTSHAIVVEVEVDKSDNFFWRLSCKGNIMDQKHLQVVANQLDFTLSNILSNLYSPIDNTYQVGHPISQEQFSLFSSIDGESSGQDDEVFFFHSGLEKFAKSHPEMPAIKFVENFEEDVTPKVIEWTYKQFNERANQIAHFLIQKGVQIEERVIVCIPRSPIFYAATLGISKAGGCYFGLDPVFPANRKEVLIKESETRYVLTLSKIAKELPVVEGVEFVTLDTDNYLEQLGRQNLENPAVKNLTMNHLGYTIFTSGTTGTPKGVLLEHSNLKSFMQNFRRYMFKPVGHKQLCFYNCTFDLHVLDLTTTTHFGGTICTAEHSTLYTNLEKIAKFFDVDYLNLTPTVSSLVNMDNLPNVKDLFVAGEQCNKSLTKGWGKFRRLINGYGPSECTLLSVTNPDLGPLTKPNNIGLTSLDCTLYIIDAESKELKLLPKGCVGEIAIAGPLVGRGYLNKPELTAEKFISFKDINGKDSRLYRSGDLGRILTDGTVECLGRCDDQVKVNGIRIELKEINEALSRGFDTIRVHTLLLTHKESPKKQLVTFVFPRQPSEEWVKLGHKLIQPEGEFNDLLQDMLAKGHKNLPVYMIPHLTLLMTNAPSTSNHKVDSRYLTKLYQDTPYQELVKLSNFQPEEEGEVTWTDLQLQIREIISQVTKTSQDTIKPTSTLFSLGVDSINSIQISYRMKRLGYPITVGEILQQGSIEKIAKLFDNREEEEELELIDIEKLVLDTLGEEIVHQIVPQMINKDNSQIEKVIPPSISQKSFIQNTINFGKAEYSFVFGFSADKILDQSRLERAWFRLQERNSMLRAVFVPVESEAMPFVQVILKNPEHNFSSEHIARVAKPEDGVNYMNSIEHRMFDYKTPPLNMHVQNFNDRTLFFINIHHMLYDAISVEVTVNELEELYLADSNEVPRTIAFENLIQYEKSADQEKLANYWKDHFKGAEVVEFNEEPIDPEGIPNFGSYRAVIPLPNMDRFNEVGASSTSILLAGLMKVQAQEIGKGNGLIGLVRMGRNAPVDGVDKMIGVCINVLPIFLPGIADKPLLEVAQLSQKLQYEQTKYESTSLDQIHEWIDSPYKQITDFVINLVRHPKDSVHSRASEIEGFDTIDPFEPVAEGKAWSKFRFHETVSMDFTLEQRFMFEQVESNFDGMQCYFPQMMNLYFDIAVYPDGVFIDLKYNMDVIPEDRLKALIDTWVDDVLSLSQVKL
ncbi:acetyl-CoA synthetase-like protein [Conidiobolus coronatus NRRL 28638]|uniref:Acetyl-CoA synthetase-like protein n=1 Tax=Conidiobolus coronatus (strain ATCC 28846 / CBS 209.66 / NRRL 28638) TaxID=796925 RepID=A0A137PFW3_CONC2|nr:acetyl-CoA synthetase-like protein [Conidiobolus coronatus NRRL 28638]|eukprot:KXN73888.1 acetyl-CoA synthetase-like protein [Conidiobolus coronatus NRRL 28638]